MEKTAIFLIPILMAVILVRLLLKPVRLGIKLAAHSACGFLCLWLLNWVAPFTGIYLPVNPATILSGGLLGIPGICIVALLEVI